MEEHLLRVADFMRRSPFVNLSLTSAPSPADAEALKEEAVTARLREFQKEKGVEDTAAALATYFKENLPDVSPPATVEEQVALLREREPAPDALLADLGRRRVEATRDRLLKTEGIPDTRLIVEETSPSASPGSTPATKTPADGPAGEGRVEFGIAAGGSG
jgi:hypothetical protein